ncbi:phage virion morphogenesis protein [Tabrizicola fusiformis]|uniref:phage virion morphogenesis protein n=1 Tax=Tabrizicola sp. SY72 TaxID=2741673 RepID=UPI001571A425|nr:phage virion morphogenesis protein [Tabrizicola sp. SY72]NTT86914.1 phage virion morphogenesis protein [Tabrizicola sp. SY72]
MFTVELKDQAVTAALMRAYAEMEDATPLMQDIGELLTESTKQRFLNGRAADGTVWAPNSASTLARKKDPRPLFGETRSLSSQIFSEAGRDQVEVGSNRIQAATMQFGAAKGAFGTMANGSPIPWGTIPARPFLGISAEDRDGILEAIAAWMSGALTAP